jgi:hypothetical protein
MGPRPSLAAFAALTIIALLSLSATPANAAITRVKLDRHTAATQQDAAPSFFARAWRWALHALSGGAPEVMLRRSSPPVAAGDASKEGVIPLLNYLDAQVSGLGMRIHTANIAGETSSRMQTAHHALPAPKPPNPHPPN